MSNAFLDFLSTHSSTLDALHLSHCTSGRKSFGVFSLGHLKTTKCEIYSADLLYLFYGRPAYKPEAGQPASKIVDLAPVCLVIDPSLLASAIRILPFDSGGFSNYQNQIGPGLTLPDFELGADPSVPLRLVTAFYETNRNYYEQIPTIAENDVPLSKAAPRAYARLIHEAGLGKMDDRCSTIEVQFNTSISLKSALRAVIGPNVVLSDPDVETSLAKCDDVTVFTYKTYGRSKPDQFVHALYERLETFLEDKGSFA